MNQSGSEEQKRCSVLFLCSANSCRSQIAEGLLRHFGGNRFEAVSAGTHPTELNPAAVEVMDAIGIDIRGQRSKSVEEMLSHEFDYVITVCDKAREFCPVFSGSTTSLHWNLDDPAAFVGSAREKKEAFIRVREELKDLILRFINSGSRMGS